MASRTGGSMVQNQNLNIQYSEAPFASKTNNVSKASKRVGLGGRKPLGDLSNSLTPSVNQISKTRCNPSETALDASKKKSTTSAKGRTNGRKALSDITNSGKPLLNAAPKKNVNPLSAVPEDIGEERFIHNHADCIKAQTRSVDMDEFLEVVGLKNDFSKKFATPRASHVPHKVKVDSPLRHLELLETAEKMVGHQPQKRKQLREINSPFPCATPESPKHYMQWKDIDCVNFKLIGTPEFLKH